jgi:hypothetical protein
LGNLEIDLNDVSNCINKLSIQVSSHPDDGTVAVYKLSSYLATTLQCYQNPSRNVIVDSAGKRHTPLTRLKKEFRFFLKYKGEHLVSLDVKNSQPYFSLTMMNASFWVEPIRPTVDGTTKKGKAILTSAFSPEVRPGLPTAKAYQVV